MKKHFYYILFIFLLSTSCDTSIPKDKLMIIDDIVLGQSKDNLTKQLDSLSIARKRFYTKHDIEEINDIFNENNFLNMYYTNAFNFSNYKNKDIEHTGLLYPSELAGTKNITGMIVILGYTEAPWFWGDAQRFENSFKEKYINQNINSKLLEEIKNLYVSKYGMPHDTITMKSHKYFLINGNHIVVNGNPDVEGTQINWETEYFNISFFTGLFDPYCIYNSKDGLYNHILYDGDISLIKADPLKSELKTYSHCYIQYELNDKAIKKLNLDRKKI